MLQEVEQLLVASLEFGYMSWYDECTCCPYGYHIDLDFVRYCESISKEDKSRSGSIKRKKNIRKQRQSMEMLLGLTEPVLKALDKAYDKATISEESPKVPKKQQAPPLKQNLYFVDDFQDVMSDFERALQRSKLKLSNNLPDVTAVSVLPAHPDGSLKSDFVASNIDSYSLSPMALQNVREALALSLERTKQLENQVKLLPELQVELEHLRKENKHLSHKLELKRTLKTNTISSSDNISNSTITKRSQSFTQINNFEDTKSDPLPPRREFGVMCGVLTRNIGVGHQYPNTKNASTLTTECADKWLPEKTKFLNLQSPKSSVSKGTQTLLVKEKRDLGVQTITEPIKVAAISYTQTDPIVKPTVSNIGCLAIPKQKEIAVQNRVSCCSIGTSDDTILDSNCEKCNVVKISIAVGPDKSDTHTIPVSLSTLGNKSKSFNLGEGRLDLQKKSRTVGSQYESNLNTVNRSSQVDIKTSSKSSQHEIKTTDKNTQYDNNSVSKNTDTNDLASPTKSVGSQVKEERPKTIEKGSNTAAIGEEKSKVCVRCTNKETEILKEHKRDEGSSPMSSKIPIPTTPVEARKFRRQDTYTKVYAVSPTEKLHMDAYKLSGLDLSPKAVSTESISPFDKVKQNLKLDASLAPTSSKSQNGINLASISQVQSTPLPVSEFTIFQPHSQNRNKAIPSKEMQGAMKVLNDSLLKTPSKVAKNQNAVNIVQQEWFRISSLVTANPLDVEDYLDTFEDMSSMLLQYIVNMTDSSGNTAMHYAVSHGNFDVVSILLDSKVCDINKTNKAGYTSVMLVSLAEVKSQTHANVVRRLFQLADVNIRASQHGQTALMLAVSHGRLDMVKMLLEAGADINIRDEDGSTALMCAAEHGHIEIVKHFLSQPDCDSSITDVDGSTALKIAMEAGHRHIGVLLYAHERNFLNSKKAKPSSPRTFSPLAGRSNRALNEAKK